MNFSKAFLTAQIARLSGLPGFPKEAAAINELCRALTKCESEKQVKEIVTDFAQGNEFSPTPAEVRKVIFARLDPSKKILPEGCGKCINGWRSYERLDRDIYKTSQNDVAEAKALREGKEFTRADEMVKN